MAFIDEIKARAKADKKTIVLPESMDTRTFEAAEKILKEGIADLIIIGTPEEITEKSGIMVGTDNNVDKLVKTIINVVEDKGLSLKEIFHIIRQSEVEKFYEYTSTIVINGIECDRYVDAGVGYFGYHDEYPEYVEIEGDKYEEAIATIPQEDLKLITIGNAKDGLYTKYIIPKKYIDKIILRRKYLHTDCIEFSLEKFYTGEEDVFELDPKNPDPEVLEMMKEYRVIINSIWE